MNKLFNVVIISIAVLAVSVFTSIKSFADGVFYVDVSGSPCVVGKSEDWTFDRAIEKLNNDDCEAVFFQKKEDGSGRVVNVENTFSISLENGKDISFWGTPVFSTGDCAGSVDGISCDGGSEPFVYDTFNQTKIEIKNIPFGRAAFEISGPGTVIFRDIHIEASCDPDKVCGPVIMLKNDAKVIFQHVQLTAGESVQAVVDVKNSAGTFFHNFISFTDGVSNGSTTITAESSGIFDFDNFVRVFPGDFEKSIWSRLGYRDQRDGVEYGPNYFWESRQTFTYIREHGAVECVMTDSRKCRIDDASLRFDWKSDPMLANHDHVILLKRGTNDKAFIMEGGNFDRTEPPFVLTLPGDFDFDANNYYALTNMGHHIRFVKSDNSSDEGSDAEEVVCSGAHMQEDDGVCVASPGYECKDGDCSTGEAFPECRGDAVPMNDSPDRDIRCKCMFAWQRISWSPGGISKCEALKGRINPQDIFRSVDAETDDVTPSSDDGSDYDTDVDAITDEGSDDICPEGSTWVDEGLMGGKCVLNADENENRSVENDAADSGSSGCSMVAGSQTPSCAGLIFLALPLIGLSVRRRLNH